MPEQWDFYFMSIDDRPASVSLDLGRAEAGPAREWPWLVCLRIPMRSPRPDGLSSSQEAPALNTLEDALADGVAAACDGAQVGRLTWNGFRELFLYVRDVERLSDGIGAAVGRVPGYDVLVRTDNDPRWRHYFEFLFPTEEQMFWIHDRRVVDQLHAAGDQLEVPRPVDHYAYFGDQGARDRFLGAATALGFRGRALPTDEKSARIGAHLVREDPVVIHHIHEVVSEVRRLAEECGGEYDGWGCPAAGGSP